MKKFGSGTYFIIAGVILIVGIWAVRSGGTPGEVGPSGHGVVADLAQPSSGEREAPVEAVSDEGVKVNPLIEVTATDHIYGNPDAPVTWFEYSDLECPFCKKLHPNLEQAIDESDGQVKWVFRHFPLSSHGASALEGAEVSECVASVGGEDKFFEYVEAYFDKTRSNGRGLKSGTAVSLAGDIGVDEAAVQECYDDGEFSAKVANDFSLGQQSGVTGTPGGVAVDVNGEAFLVPGAHSVDRLKEMFDDLLS